MSMGVSFDEFWHGDYCKLKFYEEAYFTSLERKNHELWLEGMYVYRAISAVVGAMTGASPRKTGYPEKPFPITDSLKDQKQLQEEAIERSRAELEQQRLNWIARHKDGD